MTLFDQMFCKSLTNQPQINLVFPTTTRRIAHSIVIQSSVEGELYEWWFVERGMKKGGVCGLNQNVHKPFGERWPGMCDVRLTKASDW